MGTIWTDRYATDPELGETRADLIPDEPGALLVHDGVPDRIRDPSSGLEAEVEGVEDYESVVCPNCKATVGPVRILVAERPNVPEHQLMILQCSAEKKFVVFSRTRQEARKPR